MPSKNKVPWRIEFINCFNAFAGANSVNVIKAEFRVFSPSGKESSIGIIFQRSFIDDHFKTSNRQEIDKILDEKKELFKTMSLIKIEECINKDSLLDEIEITGGELNWAHDVDTNHLLPLSQKKSNDSDIYIYFPERIITGFKQRA